MHAFFDMPWRESISYNIYETNIYPLEKFFQDCPMSSPILQISLPFKLRSIFYISPKFQQISLIHFFPIPFISLSMKLFTTTNLRFFLQTQFDPLNSVTPSIQSNSCQRIYRTRAHENQSTIFDQISASFQSGFIVNHSRLISLVSRKFSIWKLIHPSIFRDDHWFQQLHQPNSKYDFDFGFILLCLCGGETEGFLSRSVTSTSISREQCTHSIRLSSSIFLCNERKRPSRDIVAIIIRHVHFVALRFLLPPREETPWNQLWSLVEGVIVSRTALLKDN